MAFFHIIIGRYDCMTDRWTVLSTDSLLLLHNQISKNTETIHFDYSSRPNRSHFGLSRVRAVFDDL